MSDYLSSIDGLLIDIEGVLLHGSEVIPGASETLHALRTRGIPYRFITNTTIYCQQTLLERMEALGLPIAMSELFTATYAAAQYLRQQNARSANQSNDARAKGKKAEDCDMRGNQGRDRLADSPRDRSDEEESRAREHAERDLFGSHSTSFRSVGCAILAHSPYWVVQSGLVGRGVL